MADFPGKPQEEAILSRLKGDSQTPTGVTSFTGILGRSPKTGYWLLYLSLDMTRAVEIQEDDIIHSEQLAPDKSPFGSLGGTQVFVKQNAQVTTTTTSSQTKDASQVAADEFDLDIRLGSGAAAPLLPVTQKTCPDATGGCATCIATCGDDTCPRTQCETCPITHCNTCHTHCGTCVNTCPNTCANTCATCPQTCPATCANTCQTCNTNCGQNTCANTCQTCATRCQQATCHTCNTRCQQDTCVRTDCIGTCDTCIKTCLTCHPNQCF